MSHGDSRIFGFQEIDNYINKPGIQRMDIVGPLPNGVTQPNIGWERDTALPTIKLHKQAHRIPRNAPATLPEWANYTYKREGPPSSTIRCIERSGMDKTILANPTRLQTFP